MKMRISEELSEVVRRKDLLTHPFYRAWSEGALTKDQLRSYAAQYYRQVEAFPRWVSSVHSRCPDLASRKVLLSNLVDEELHGTDHPSLWLQFTSGLGMTTEEVVESRPTAQTQRTVNELFALTEGEWTEGLCALFAYECQVPEVSKSKIDGLRRFYGITDPRSLEFFTAHLAYDVEHANAAASLIDRHSDRRAAVQAAERASTALWSFLDGVSEQIGLHCN